MNLVRTAEEKAAEEEWKRSMAAELDMRRQSMTAELDRRSQDAAPNRWSWFQIVVVILLAWIAVNLELVVTGILRAGVEVG